MTRLPGEPDRVAEVQEEMRLHFDLRVDRLVREGVDPEEARARVGAEFGDREAARAECERIGRWERRRARRRDFATGLRADLRLALRRLLSTPGRTVVLIGTLATGVAGATLVAGLLETTLAPDVPVDRPDRTVRLWTANPAAGQPFDLTAPFAVDVWRETGALSAVAGWTSAEANLTPEGGEPVHARLLRTNAEFFRVVGRPPHLGSYFEFDGADGATDEAVLGWESWNRRFAADPDIVGTTVELDGRPYRIVGVLPRGVAELFDTDLVTPLTLPEAFRTHPRALIVNVVGRLTDGVDRVAAQDRLTSAGRAADTSGGPDLGVVVESISASARRSSGQAVTLLGVGLGLLVLIATANTVGLVLARMSRRRGSLAVQKALGASTAQIVRGVAIEGVAFAVFAAILGLVAAHAALQLLAGGSDPLIRSVESVALSPGAIAVGTGTAAVTLVIFSGLTLVSIVRRTDGAMLVRGGPSSSAGGARRWIVGGQIGLAVLLLAVGGVLSRTARSLVQEDPGVRSAGVVTVDVSLPLTRYPDPESRVEFWRSFTDRLSARSEVASATVGRPFAFGAHPRAARFQVGTEAGGSAEAGFGSGVEAAIDAVDGRHGEVLGYRLLAGRPFDGTEGAESEPVAMVNANFAREFGGAESAPGRTIRIGADGPPIRVVGVVPDLGRDGPGATPRPVVYRPVGQTGDRSLTVSVRAASGTRLAAAAARTVLQALDSNLPTDRLSTLEAQIRAETRVERAVAGIARVFGLMALFATMVGVYGIVSWGVSARRQEFQIRRAIGARESHIALEVMRDAGRFTLPGALAGGLAAVVVLAGLPRLTPGLPPGDPLGVAFEVGGILGTALVAALLPALADALRGRGRVIRMPSAGLVLALLLAGCAGAARAPMPVAPPAIAFAEPVPVAPGGTSGGAAWVDVDGDGDLDLHLARAQGEPDVLLRNESGRLVPWRETEITRESASTSGVCWGDADGDGRLDVAHANQHGEADRVVLDPSGALRRPGESDLLAGGDNYHCLWVDLDRDGVDELLRADAAGDSRILTGFGSGGSRVEEVPAAWAGDGTPIGGAAFADLDLDGDDDLILPNPAGPDRLFLREPGGWTAADSARAGDLWVDGGMSVGAAWGDADGDLDLDVIVTRLDGTTALYLNPGAAAGSFVRSDALDGVDPGTQLWSAVWFDADQDGDLELLTSSYDAGLRVLEWGDGRYRVAATLLEPRPGELASTSGVALGDVDGDGDLDLAVPRWDGLDDVVVENLADRSGGRSLEVHVERRSGAPVTGGTALLVWRDDEGAERRSLRPLAPVQGIRSQHAPGAHFGLGHRGRAVRVTVRVPGGTERTVELDGTEHRARLRLDTTTPSGEEYV